MQRFGGIDAGAVPVGTSTIKTCLQPDFFLRSVTLTLRMEMAISGWCAELQLFWQSMGYHLPVMPNVWYFNYQLVQCMQLY